MVVDGVGDAGLVLPPQWLEDSANHEPSQPEFRQSGKVEDYLPYPTMQELQFIEHSTILSPSV